MEKKIFSAALVHGIYGTEAEIFGKVPQIPYDEGAWGSHPKGGKAVCVSELASLAQTDSNAIIFPKKKRKII